MKPLNSLSLVRGYIGSRFNSPSVNSARVRSGTANPSKISGGFQRGCLYLPFSKNPVKCVISRTLQAIVFIIICVCVQTLHNKRLI